MNLTRTHGGTAKTRRVCVVSECGGPVMMADRPILFSGPMVRALLDGRKTQTRRVLKNAPTDYFLATSTLDENEPIVFADDENWQEVFSRIEVPVPYAPSDRLWVREKGWERPERTPQMMRDGADTWEPFYYDADDLACFEHEQFNAWGFKRRPSIHMPRWASRLTLIVSDVRVQRLQDISEDDAAAEGLISWEYMDCDGDPRLDGRPYKDTGWHWEPQRDEFAGFSTAVGAFRNLWDNLNASRGNGWEANPWVVAISFDVIKANIDEASR